MLAVGGDVRRRGGDDLEAVELPARRAGARLHVAQRPPGDVRRRQLHDQSVRLGAGELQHARPVRGEEHRYRVRQPREANRRSRELGCLTATQPAHQPERVAELRELHRREAERADGAVTAADPQRGAPVEELRDGREHARDHRRVTRDRVRHQRADAHPRRRHRRRRQIWRDLVPDHVRVAEPDVVEADVLGNLDGREHVRQREVPGPEHQPEAHHDG